MSLDIFLQFYGVIIFNTQRQEFVLKEFSYSQLILKKDPKSTILSSIPSLTCKFLCAIELHYRPKTIIITSLRLVGAPSGLFIGKFMGRIPETAL